MPDTTTFREEVDVQAAGNPLDFQLWLMKRTLDTLRFVQRMEGADTDGQLELLEGLSVQETHQRIFSMSAGISALLKAADNSTEQMIADAKKAIALDELLKVRVEEWKAGAE